MEKSIQPKEKRRPLKLSHIIKKPKEPIPVKEHVYSLEENGKEVREIYLIGTGPSLKDVDVSLLKDKDTISFNRSYLSYEEWGFEPTYYMIIDHLLLASIKDDLNDLIKNSKIKKFFIRDVLGKKVDWRSKDIITDSNNVTFFKAAGKKFKNEYPIGYYGTVGLCSLQALKMMGYNRVYLLGCDMNYRTSKASAHPNSDTNHYRNDYYAKNMEYGAATSMVYSRWNTFIKTELEDIEDFEVISITKNSKLNHLLTVDKEKMESYLKKNGKK